MKNRMKINVAAVLLAVVMMCVMPVHAFAAGVPSLDEVRNAWLKGDSSIKLSDYYFIYNYSAKDRSGEFYDFTTITVVDDSFKGQLFAYRDDNSTPVGGNIYFMSFCDDKIITGAEAGVYVRNATYYNINGSQLNSASGLGGGYDMKYLGSDIMKNFNISDTNIPLFDSKESAENYFNTGDTSGLLNGDKFQTYDKSIETPRDMRVDMDADFRAQMGYAPSNAPDDANASNSTCVFTWSQSDEVVEAGNYETEIYYQTTFVHHSNMFAIGKKTFSLSSSVLVASVPVTRTGMTYTMDFKQITKIYEEWQDSGLIGGTLKPTYPTEPYYFYIRNKAGNNYGNWVRVTVTNDNITTSNTVTGASTVTGGYDEIDGSSATLPGVNQKLDGDTVADSQYGKKYSVDIDSADLDSVVGKLRKGFGILGDNGLIALLNGFFSFIPDEYFSVLITFVSGACILGVLFLVLRR